ncbi:MAG: hypothetical protein WCP21_07500, partial [Armatimonadota bacterium]
AVTLPIFLSRLGCDEAVGALSYSVSGLDSLGESFCLVPATPVPLPETFAPDTGLISFALPPLTVPDDACLLKIEAKLVGQAANWCYLEVRDGALPSAATVLRKLAGEVEVSTAWHEAEVERGVVDFEQHLLGGIEAGNMDYRFVLPEGKDLSGVNSLTLLFEASSKRHGAPQTSEDKWLSDLYTSVNGVPVDKRTLNDQPADSRGALSHLHGLWGRYGELVRLKVSGDQLAQIKATGKPDLLVRLDVPRSSLNHRGLVVYSSRAGRYPVDVTMIVG